MKKITRSYFALLFAIALGIAAGFTKLPLLLGVAGAISSIFINFLQLIAAPVVFLSILSTILGMKGFDEMKTLGKRVLGYTVVTTILATVVALFLFLMINPLQSIALQTSVPIASNSESYLSFLINIVPSNLVKAFLENHVIGIAFLAFILGIAGLQLPVENRKTLDQFFSSLFKLALKVAEFVILLMPLGIFAFTTLLVEELQGNASNFKNLALYLSVVLGANLVQGLVILPLILKMKGLSPFKTAKGSVKPLLLAFFSKSSNATLPVTLESAEKNLGINPRVARFSLPLCTVINMNGCAAFILTTVLFVAGMHGHVFTPVDLIMWVVLATVAAIGNAGVPMGCFFLASSFLVGMNVPLTTMGLILPFYAFLDMVETALNVWSDISVAAMVDKDVKQEIAVVT